MGRRATGFALKPHRSGFWYVRFTHQGRRHDLSTGSRDKEAAYSAAQKIYAEFISGRRTPTPITSARGGMSIVDAGAEWLASISGAVDPLTLSTYERYVATLFAPFFGTVEMIPDRAEIFGLERLKRVQRDTVLKELSGLRGLARWAFGDKVADAIPSPQRKATGRVVFDRKVTELAPKTVRKILAALRHPTQNAYFTVMYETGLRPATLYELRVPEHYRRGAAVLRITAAIDKARYDRELPLTAGARKALDVVAPDSGLIFGKHDYRIALERACKAAGVPRCTPYDLRHAMGTHAVERTGNLPGVAYLMGHRNTATTSARYVHPSKRAALAVLKGLK